MQDFCTLCDLQAMQQFEECGRVAHILQSSDPTIGGVLSKSVNLLFTSLRDGIVAPSSLYAATSLMIEREVAVQYDCNKSDPIRFLVYEISSMMGTLIKNCNEKTEEAAEEMEISASIKDELIEELANEHSATFPEDHPDQVDPLVDTIEPITEGQHYDNIIDAHQSVKPIGDNPVSTPPDNSLVNIFAAYDDVKTKQPDLEETLDESKDEQFLDNNYEETEGESDTTIQGLEDSVDNVDESLDTGNEENYAGTLGISVQQSRKQGRPSQVSADKKGNEKLKSRSNISHKCTICAKVFQQKCNLRDHMAVHTGERAYACTLCPKAFKASGKLARHKRSVHGLNQFSCGKCQVVFKKKCELKQHVAASTCGSKKKKKKTIRK